jgi:hypothetical protein
LCRAAAELARDGFCQIYPTTTSAALLGAVPEPLNHNHACGIVWLIENQNGIFRQDAILFCSFNLSAEQRKLFQQFCFLDQSKTKPLSSSWIVAGDICGDLPQISCCLRR